MQNLIPYSTGTMTARSRFKKSSKCLKTGKSSRRPSIPVGVENAEPICLGCVNKLTNGYSRKLLPSGVQTDGSKYNHLETFVLLDECLIVDRNNKRNGNSAKSGLRLRFTEE